MIFQETQKCYIACYIIGKVDDRSKDVLLNDNNFYHQNYGDLDHGFNIIWDSGAQ